MKKLGILMVLALVSSATVVSTDVMAKKRKKLDDTITMDETSISGDKELPQVLYVVPWQDAKGDQLYQPVVGYDDGIGFIDQKQFGRETSYANQLQGLQE